MSEWKVTGAPRFVEGIGMVYPVTKGGSCFDVREQEELEALLAGWEPIETAPKDHVTEIDLWANGERYADCIWGVPTYGACHCWIQLNAEYDSNGPVDVMVSSATHWMPRPAPPKN